ncbi:hypothetical protein [Bacillus sp. MRMR6]|uniref:hypothetical protein n=1 Tax=Bacillus sp. MRMR6 TaxID=1928617 RepID=UPI000952A979|nr:hypothetical protein [Bacillus sp. MRMR6]OLS40633.1 hypothetical protein BTR25_09035 [Bacillus sp. MRMR6]
MKWWFVLILTVFIAGCNQSDDQTHETNQPSVESESEPEEQQDVVEPEESSGQGTPNDLPGKGSGQVSPTEQPNKSPADGSSIRGQTEIAGILKVKQKDMVILFHDDIQIEKLLHEGEYDVVKMVPSEEHVGVIKYYLSNKEYVYIDDSYKEMVEFFPNMGEEVHEEEVIGTLIINEPDIILLYDDAAGTSTTVPAGHYNVIRKEETPYPDTFQFYISEKKYFYLNDLADEYVEYIKKTS